MKNETGNVIVERFKGINYVHTPGVWLRTMDHSHGETDADNAVYNAVVMEEVAKMALFFHG